MHVKHLQQALCYSVYYNNSSCYGIQSNMQQWMWLQYIVLKLLEDLFFIHDLYFTRKSHDYQNLFYKI